jgi:hypothetical protein
MVGRILVEKITECSQCGAINPHYAWRMDDDSYEFWGSKFTEGAMTAFSSCCDEVVIDPRDGEAINDYDYP